MGWDDEDVSYEADKKWKQQWKHNKWKLSKELNSARIVINDYSY